MNKYNRLRLKLQQTIRIAFAVGLIGTILSAGTAVLVPDQFFPSYLVAFTFWTGVALGSLAIRLLHHLTVSPGTSKPTTHGHFVDLVWVYLFPCFYLIAARGPAPTWGKLPACHP
jgi:hypothetical protein